jgi:uncharacterized protein
MHQLSSIIANLKQSSGDADQVEVIETHISWVLLIGEFAYKIKKPVNLGFVDFSSLEKRLLYCHEEMRLNGRLAPDLYMSVVPVNLSENSALRFDGSGPTFDYAVKMRRFSQEFLLDRMIERGDLLPWHIDTLAIEVAEFHGKTDIATHETDFGSLESVWHPLSENFKHIPILPAHPQQAEQVDKLYKSVLREFQNHESDFQQRKTERKICECHGDLHLGNMILNNEQIVLFDCIEFNENLRWIDVMSEVAFTVMDIENHGRADLAYRFLNIYLQQTGDYSGLKVLRYYLVYRATVRAKVAGIRLSQPGVTLEERNTAGNQLQNYLDLAEQYITPVPHGIVITHGLSGSGKSTITQELMQVLPAIRIRSDIERKRLCPNCSNKNDLYSDSINEKAYGHLAKCVTATIKGGFTAIVDATFLKEEKRQDFYDLANDLNVNMVVLDFDTSEEVLKERVLQRSGKRNDVSDADLEVLNEQIKNYKPLTGSELPHSIKLNTEKTIDISELTAHIHRFFQSACKLG